MKFTVEKINDIIASLDYVVPAQPRLQQDGELTAQEAFILMAPKLNELIEKGATIKELTDFLKAMACPIKGAALRRHLDGYLAVQTKLRQASEAKATEVKKRRKKNPPIADASAKKSDSPTAAKSSETVADKSSFSSEGVERHD